MKNFTFYPLTYRQANMFATKVIMNYPNNITLLKFFNKLQVPIKLRL